MDSGGETAVATGPRRAARRPGFMGEIAEGIAGAVLSAPGLAAAVLLAAALWLSDSLGSIAVAHAAGIALSRVSAPRRLVILFAWTALAAVQWFTRFGGSELPREWADWRAIEMVISLVVVAWGAGRRDVWVAAVVVAAAAGGAVCWPRTADLGSRSFVTGGLAGLLLIQLGFVAAIAVLVALGHRGWTIAAIVVVVLITLAGFFTTAAFAGSALAGKYLVWWAVSAACGVVALFIPVVSGMAARAASRGASADDGALFVTTLARRPWCAALALGVVLLATANTPTAFLPGGNDPAARAALLGRIASASTLMAALASGAAGAIGALAPLSIASLFALCSWGLRSTFSSAAFADELEAHGAVRSAAYLVPQVLARAALVPVLGLWRFAMPLVAVAVILPPAAWSLGIDGSPWTELAWVFVVTATCVALTSSGRPAAQIVAGAVVLGLAQRLAMQLVPAGPHAQLQPSSWFELPAAWMLAAVLVVVARRARTMTAIPIDHPVFVDFQRAA